MRGTVFLLVATLVTTTLVQGGRAGQTPTRDAGAQDPAKAQPETGLVAGRVVAADSGRPVGRARVRLSGPSIPGGRGTLTDREGRFELAELPPGRYTLSAAKTGFVTIAYGQRRPLQAGTPIQLEAGQQMTSVDLRLPRGSVVAGRVYDEAGEPLPGAAVRVLRYEYAQGFRQLIPVGSAQTDDLGAYRVWGLNPGEYYVSAAVPNVGVGGRGGQVFVGRGGGQGAGDEQIGYAPTYYPGAPSIAEARSVTVGLSSEATGIDFGVLTARTARVAGHVTGATGHATTAGNVTLAPESGGLAGRGPGLTYGSRIDWDGSFAMAGVPPGRYELRARADDTVAPEFARVPLTISGSDVADLTVILAPAASISATVTFQGAAQPDPGQFRITAPLVDGGTAGPNPSARVERDGRFTLTGLQAGLHLLRAQGGARNWVLKSATVDGRDALDTAFELRSGQELTGVRLVFTDQLTEITGTITDSRRVPVTEFTVLAFPVDDALWRPLSRHIFTARPDQNGRFQLRGLPPGDYYLAAVDPAEQGEWFEPPFLETHRASSVRVSLTEGDVRTQDFTVDSR